MLINREKEIDALKKRYDSDKAEFIAIYGRRRVGKIYLVDEVFKEQITFRHAGLSPVSGMNTKDQLNHFYQSLKTNGLMKAKKPKNWLEAFYLLQEYLTSKRNGNKLVIFIDEIQWMDTKKSDFITGLESFWNNWACFKNDIMLIVCGSSTSWVLDKLINNHGGLYGRLTEWFKLEQFSLLECEKYLINNNHEISRYDIIQTYMAIGGIPYYLDMLNQKLSFAENIDNLFFSKNAKLKDEFDRIFTSIFVDSEKVKTIIRSIASKKRGLTRSEIIDMTKLPSNGELSSILKSLENGDFITKYSSYKESKKVEYYKLVDPFCLFYLHFVDNKLINNEHYWSNIINTPSINVWEGLSFENVCFNHIKQIKFALGIGGISTNEYMWSKKGDLDQNGTQIDLIIERKDNIINMCEIKFYSDDFVVDKGYHELLIRRKNLLFESINKKTSVHNTLITTFGLKHNMYSSDFINVITIKDLFTL